MQEVRLIKMPGGMLRPADEGSAEVLEPVRNGAYLSASIKQPRNPEFHKKYFVMLDFFYDYWEPPEDLEYNGLKPEKDRERFRKDVQIMAGFRKLVVNVKGECRYESESISFGSMDETRFAQVYQGVFNVCWKLVMQAAQTMTPEEAENAINQALSFD